MLLGLGKKRALTLVELLVVIVILVILVAVVLPLAQPNSNARVVREAARQVNAFFASVQARALAENRSYGVILIRDKDDSGPCYDLAMARAPRSIYTGDETGGVAIKEPDDDTWQRTLTETERVAQSQQAGNPFIDAGDRIRFNYRGPWYVIEAVTIDEHDHAKVRFAVPPGSPSVAPPEQGSLPFQVRRMPRIGKTLRSARSTMTLPVGAYIDVSVSGVGVQEDEPDYFDPPEYLLSNPPSNPLTGPVIVMVDAQGRLSTLEFNDAAGDPQSVPIDGSLYLLVGAAKPIAGGGFNEVRNLWPDSGSVWLTVASATGRLTTVQSLGAEFVVNGADARVTAPDGGVFDFNLNDINEASETGRYRAIAKIVNIARTSANTGPAMGGR